MERENKNKLEDKIKKLPNSSGVYFFKDDSGSIIYIGKATSLKSRVSSYFTKVLDNKTAKLVSNIGDIGYKKTDTVIEALILEANLINKYKPKFNIKLKDDKSFAYVVITAEEYPRILTVRPTDKKKIRIRNIFGPFTSKDEAEKVIDLLLKILNPSKSRSGTSSLYRKYYVKGYPSGKIGDISKEEYEKFIRNIKLFFEGKKNKIIKELERGMSAEAKNMNFEKAAEIRDQIFSLKHIRDFALIKMEDISNIKRKKFPDRVEAYDVSNISGKFSVGSMVVFSLGKPDKKEYKKFKIKTVGKPDDIAMLREILTRRFLHSDWKIPDLIVIDGGLGQKNTAKIVLQECNLDIPIVAIAKGRDRKGEKLFFSSQKGYIFPDVEFIKKIRDEAHRFAISYHKKLRRIR